MIDLIIIENPFEAKSRTEIKTDDLYGALRAHFRCASLPPGTRFYHQQFAEDRNVTPECEADIDRLLSLSGLIYVVVFPGTPLNVLQIALAIALSAVSMLLTPKPDTAIPVAAQRNIQSESPNNELSARTNQARLNGRIPDIFGQVRATPDLIAVPYSIFDNHTEKEIMTSCLGRGAYETDAEKDGDTLLTDIAGASLAIYAPYTSPNSGDAPQKQIGSAITDPMLDAVKATGFNGQVLQPRNQRRVEGASNIRFVYPDKIQINSPSVRFDDHFQAGNPISVIVGTVSGYNLSGNYTAVSVSSTEIGLSNPSAVNASWSSLSGLPGGATAYASPIITAGIDVGAGGSAGDAMRYIYPGTIGSDNTSKDFRTLFEYGDLVQVRAGETVTVPSFSENYQVTAKSATELTLNTAPKPAPWAYLAGLVGQSYNPPATDGVYGNTDLAGDLDGNGSYENVATSVDIRFVYPNKIQRVSGSVDLAALVGSTNMVKVTRDAWTFSLAGSFELNSAATAAQSIALVGTDWSALNRIGGTSPWQAVYLAVAKSAWVGPTMIDKADLSKVLVNFVASNGSYRDDGTSQYPLDVVNEVELTPVDVDGNELFGPGGVSQREYFQATLSGSGVSRTTRAVTLWATPAGFTGRCNVRVRRVSLRTTASGLIVDEVRVRDVYGAATIDQHDFGDVTICHSATFATSGALAVKERKLNMLATRKVPQRDGSGFTTTLYPTMHIADILCFVALDPYIGRRTIAELDLDNIYDTIAEVISYFGNYDAAKFCYTFDKQNMSFEETFSVIAGVAHCSAYRRGSKIQLFFEKLTENSALLFNHRNKIPGTEKRQTTFGRGGEKKYDGVKLDYVDPKDDSIASYDIPEDQSATNPEKIETIGIRTRTQAYHHAKRAYNKQLYGYSTVEFEALQEAQLLRRNERILVADNTRAPALDGEVLAQDGLILTLSQPIVFEEGEDYKIFLQHISGTVEAISISAVAGESRQVLLDGAPSESLSLDPRNAVRCGYIITKNTGARETAFLLLERTPSSQTVSTVRAMRYDDRYYQNDLDISYQLVVDELGSDLLAYWDAQAVDTITSDQAGVTSSWLDVVGGYEAKQPTRSRRPVYSPSSFNGRAGIYFDGTNDYASGLSLPFPVGTPQIELWLVISQDASPADTSNRSAFGYGGTFDLGGINIGRTVVGGVNRALLRVGNGTTTVSVTGSNVDFSGRHVMRAQIGSSSSSLTIDGVSEGSASVVPYTGGNTAVIGRNSAALGTMYWHGQIACVLVTNPLSSGKASTLNTFLNGRRRP